ncbi:MAG: DUF6677 family protein [Planctomycetota bacterium]
MNEPTPPTPPKTPKTGKPANLEPSAPKAAAARRARRSAAGLNLAAAVLGWALPGLGHLALGHTARGLVLAATIGSLWLGGLLIGGISVIDRRDHPAWFIGQMMVAPAWVVDRYHDHLRQTWNRRVGTEAHIDRGYVPAHGKPEEQGTLYTALAGLLNLLAIIDVLYRKPVGVAEPDESEVFA